MEISLNLGDLGFRIGSYFLRNKIMVAMSIKWYSTYSLIPKSAYQTSIYVKMTMGSWYEKKD